MAYRTITIRLVDGTTITKRVDERGIVPKGGTQGQALVKLSDTDFDVDFGGELAADWLDLKTSPEYSPAVPWKEGRLFWDEDKKAVSYYNENPEMTVNLAHENIIRVYNDTGSDIPNGAVVYPTGAYGSANTIALANARFKDKCRLVALTTTAVPNGGYGYVTKFGEVGGLNTLQYGVGSPAVYGLVYLSADVDGEMTAERPSDDAFVVIIGTVKKAHASEGELVVDILVSDSTVEVDNVNGFSDNQRNALTLAFNDATRELTLTPTGSVLHFYEEGEKFELSEAATVTISDVEGQHLIYFDGGVLTAQANPTTAQRNAIILNKCLVCGIYWNATDGKHEVDITDHRHSIGMSGETQLYLDKTQGAIFYEGLAVGNVLADESGAIDTHAQFSVAPGSFLVADIEHLLTETIEVGDTIRVIYLSGAGLLRTGGVANFAVATAGSGRLAYNLNTAGVWSVEEVTDGGLVLYHVFALNGESTKIISIMGQAEYGNALEARNGANNEIAGIITLAGNFKIVPIATIIYQTKDTYANAVKARIRTTDEGGDYIDWRVTALAQGAPATDHNNLSNLQLAGAGITWGHMDEARFNLLPTSPEAAAIKGANAPGAGNVFATMADIGSGGGASPELTADELAAIQGANAPSASNVFITENAVKDVVEAGNGLRYSYIDGKLGLGGTVTEDTTIKINETAELYFKYNPEEYVEILFGIVPSAQILWFAWDDGFYGPITAQFGVHGFEYSNDYSAYFTDRTLPDCEWVASQINDAISGISQLSADELAAIQGANAPGAGNVFATMADVPPPTSPELTADELAAIQGANAPGAGNVFATIADLPAEVSPELTADELAAIQGAAAPSAANVFATTADLYNAFGSGVDGDVTISTTVTLTRNMEYNNLTITTSGKLLNAGFIVKVKGTLEIQGSGVIGCPGNDGQNEGSTSVGGAVTFTHNYNGPAHTGSGGNGGRATAVAVLTFAGAAAGSVSLENNNAPYSWRRGGGGGGGAYYGGSGIPPAVAAVAGGATGYGAAGGSGGASVFVSPTPDMINGGSGGGGGGVLELWAHTVNNGNATNGINCNGGNGGNGRSTAYAKSGNGGGGGGGCCVVYYHAETGSGLNGNPKAAGGAAGTGGNSGTAGATGTAITLQI